MTSTSSGDAFGRASDWLVGTARNNPEALLLFAAGCCLLLRSGSGIATQYSGYGAYSSSRYPRGGADLTDDMSSTQAWREGRGLGSQASAAAQRFSEGASDFRDQVTEQARSYAGAVSDFAQQASRNIADTSRNLADYAQETGRTMADQSQRLAGTMQTNMQRLWSEQPVAVALLGLAAGVAIAAAFRSTRIEQQMLGDTRDALGDAAGRMRETLKDAADEASERLKTAASERGLDADGLKEMARDVAGTFTQSVAGKSHDSSPSMVPEHAPSESLKTDQNGHPRGKEQNANRGTT